MFATRLFLLMIRRAAPLTVHLQPQVQIVDVGKDAEFQCIVSGHPVYEINWLHDGKPIIRDNRIEVSLNGFAAGETYLCYAVNANRCWVVGTTANADCRETYTST